MGRAVVAWAGAGERTLGACSWCIQLLLVALVGNERGGEPPAGRVGLAGGGGYLFLVVAFIPLGA